MSDQSKQVTKPADITLPDWQEGDVLSASRFNEMQRGIKSALGVPGADLPGLKIRVIKLEETPFAAGNVRNYDPTTEEWKDGEEIEAVVDPEGQSVVAFSHNGVWVKIASGTTKARLTSNLDANGYATAQPLVFNSSSKSYDDDSEQEEITVYETMGCYCGIEGEIIEVRSAGTDSGGETIWEVVRGGATYQTGTLADAMSQGDTVSVNISGRSGVSVDATDVFLPSPGEGETIELASGTLVGITYNTRPDSPRWEVTGAPGDQCETCPDPCV